ncbi:MAG: hypothetical protein WBG23_07660 [Acidobacteriaceae bacterium]|jgi:hypothetical protein
MQADPERGAKSRPAATLAGRIQHSGNGRWIGNRVSIEQNDVTADSKKFLLLRDFNSFMKAWCGGHHG